MRRVNQNLSLSAAKLTTSGTWQQADNRASMYSKIKITAILFTGNAGHSHGRGGRHLVCRGYGAGTGENFSGPQATVL